MPSPRRPERWPCCGIASSFSAFAVAPPRAQMIALTLPSPYSFGETDDREGGDPATFFHHIAIMLTVAYLVLDTDVAPEHGGVPEETESGSPSACRPGPCCSWESSVGQSAGDIRFYMTNSMHSSVEGPNQLP